MIAIRTPIPTAPRPSLPSYRELTAVFAHPLRPEDGQLLRWARQLSVVHRVHRLYPDQPTLFEGTRADLRARIAASIVAQLAADPAAGDRCAAAIDDLAAAHVAAHALLRTAIPAPEEQLHAAWSEVGYIATLWADLVAEVVDGQPPAPAPDRARS